MPHDCFVDDIHVIKKIPPSDMELVNKSLVQIVEILTKLEQKISIMYLR